MTAVASARGSPAWVECLGTVVEVRDQRVRCPVTGTSVPVARCLDCHFLEAMEDERDPGGDCHTPDRFTQGVR